MITTFMEYAGEAIEELSVDERATMTNMAAEIGGFTGIVAPDRKAVEFLVERRGMDRKQVEAMMEGLYSDPDAQYAHVIELNADDITPMVATPGDPGNPPSTAGQRKSRGNPHTQIRKRTHCVRPRGAARIADRAHPQPGVEGKRQDLVAV